MNAALLILQIAAVMLAAVSAGLFLFFICACALNAVRPMPRPKL